MKKSTPIILGVIITLSPNLVFAQSLQALFTNIPNIISDVLIPFLFGMAFLIFVYNVIRYFVFGADNKDLKENAKNLALYSVAAFVFLVVLFGIVNILSDFTGLEDKQQPCSDYEEQFGVCP